MTAAPIVAPRQRARRAAVAPRTSTLTPVLGLILPEVGGDPNLWGGYLNTNFAAIDAGLLPLAGGTLTGPLILAADATAGRQATTYQQLASGLALKLNLAGGTLSGPLTLAADAAASLQPVSLQQLNTKAGLYLPLAGGTLTGALVLAANGAAPLQPAAYGQLTSGLALKLDLAGGTLTGALVLAANGAAPLQPAAYGQLTAGLALKLDLAGGTLTGPLLLSRDPVGALEAATKQWVNAQISGVAGITEAPNDGSTYGRVSLGWAKVLPLTGGTLTGTLILAADGASGLQAASYQQLTAGLAGKLALGGGTLTGALTLAADAAASLQPVSLQQLNAKAALYLPLTGGTLTGALTVGATVTAGLSTDSGATLVVNAAATTDRLLSFQTAAKPRWVFRANTTAESGGSAGSNFSLIRYADDGTTQLGIPLSVVRSTGVATFAQIPVAPTATAGDSSTNLATTAFVATAAAPAANNVGRNLLNNALFLIAQRGTGPFTANGYTADRWRLNLLTDANSVTLPALSDASRTAIADEYATITLANTFTGTAGSTAFSVILQATENVRRLAGKTVTLSFWAQAAAGTPKLGASLDQVFGTGGSPSATVSGTGQSVTLSTTWTRYSLSFTLASISGKTLGSNADDCTMLFLWYSSGSANNTRAGGIGVQSATISLWGLQLELGSSATPLEKLDYSDDWRHCARFYQVGQLISSGYAAAASQVIYYSSMLPAPMRATPTVVLSPVSPTNCGTFVGGGYSGLAIWINAAATATGPYIANASFTATADL